MGVFPRTTSAVNDLTQTLLDGLDQHGELFPSITLEMQSQLGQAQTNLHDAVVVHESAKASARTAVVARDNEQAVLEEKLRKVLNLAVNDSMDCPENLQYIGWSARKTPSPLQAPGQPVELEATKEGPGILTLKWMKPSYGGTPAIYNIQRADQQPGGMPGEWVLLTNSYGNSITLQNQPRMTELQYRVIATNQAGDSMPSNIATAVL